MVSADRQSKSIAQGNATADVQSKGQGSATGRPITVEHVKLARDNAYAAFVKAANEGRSQEAVEHLKEYKKYEAMVSEMLINEQAK